MAISSDSDNTFDQKLKRGERDEKVPRTGESSSDPNDSPNSSSQDAKPMNCPKLPNVLKYSARPDTKVLETTIIPHSIIIRKTELASHVLVMGTLSYGYNPIKCPLYGTVNGDACKNLCYTSTETLKAHLQAAHALTNVQINLLCPCPAECNGNMECPVVVYDQHTGMFLENHLTTAHEDHFEKLQTLMCCMNPDDKSDFLEEFLEEYDLKLEDMAYLKHLDGRKTFPEWVYNTTQPFPSQLIPDKFVIPTVVENYCLRYVCNVEPCKDNIIRNSQQMRIHIFIVHKSQVRRETDVFFGCPAQGCEAIARCNTKDMISHVKAVHPLLCGKPGCSETALEVGITRQIGFLHLPIRRRLPHLVHRQQRKTQSLSQSEIFQRPQDCSHHLRLQPRTKIRRRRLP
ncbi:uncharacterized protein LOC129592187 isoform X2 [Paramacrobiotus metropolitanus]|uniref:uncharacterized protein LOC129592187 isoform X2 n=1 Tax=Paramacrobiotus metropolitanus TaxID=2943436 RepID=UPI0024465D5C|nr:uncharacterized protein LOC129592187 isoform X2 [Paramacrobiotus metropolitanus]